MHYFRMFKIHNPLGQQQLHIHAHDQTLAWLVESWKTRKTQGSPRRPRGVEM